MQLFLAMPAMRDASLRVVFPRKTDACDDRFPYWACAVTILGISAVSYWALFRLIWTLAH
jgi:hypothetical protein